MSFSNSGLKGPSPRITKRISLDFLSVLKATIYKKVIEHSFRGADRIVTVSESMRNEILGFYPNLPISVIYNGIDVDIFEAISEADLARVRSRLGLPEQFLLTVGHLEKRKN